MGLTVEAVLPAARPDVLAELELRFGPGDYAAGDVVAVRAALGGRVALATWRRPTAGLPRLENVHGLLSAGLRPLAFAAISECVRGIVAEGYRRGYFEMYERPVYELVVRTFRVIAEVVGVDGESGEPAAWRVEVDLVDALVQLGPVRAVA